MKEENKQISTLMKIPLLRRALTDQYVQIQPRAVDNEWLYNAKIPFSVSAFNPSHRKIYISYESAIAQWLRDGKRRERVHNERDILVREVLFLIHDYLHCWAYMMIQDIMPRLKFGFGEINDETAEIYTFCHLLTESAATVGLDYWYMSTIDLNQLCNLGTGLKSLTVSYHDMYLPEYRKFSPTFTAQRPEMFNMIATFYCTGEFPIFTINDLKRSPALESWLQHELTYGEQQRIFTREWLTYLSNNKIHYDRNELKKKVSVGKPWQKMLMDKLSERLWNLVKHDKPYIFKKPVKNPKFWRRSKSDIPDFRFTNLNRIDFDKVQSIRQAPNYEENFRFFYSQYLSSFNFKKAPKEFLDILSSVLKEKNLDGLLALVKLSKLKKCKGPKSEPVDLFFLN